MRLFVPNRVQRDRNTLQKRGARKARLRRIFLRITHKINLAKEGVFEKVTFINNYPGMGIPWWSSG